MESIVGIFRSIGVAEQAVEELRKRDMPEKSIALLSSEAPQSGKVGVASEKDVDRMAHHGTPAEGAGKNAGTTLGATIGGTAGFTAGATAASLMVPGLGVIFAVGLGAAALLGVGGAAAGAKLGDTIEDSVDTGASPEEKAFYRELLRRGYSLVMVNVRSGADTSTVHEVFRQLGSVDVEKARQELGKAA